MNEVPFTLVLDDESTGLGDAALRLLRLGVDVFYANDPDEAIVFCSQPEARLVRAVMFPEGLATDALERVVSRLPATAEGAGPSLVAVGELADDHRLVELRKAGAERALRPPFDDATLRWVVNAARFEHDHEPKRRHTRAPTNLLARASWGLKRKDLVCSSLSPGGAFLETPSPLNEGTRIKLKLPLPSGSVTLKAVVANHSEGRGEGTSGELRPAGMGVTFLDPGEADRSALAEYVQARLAEFVV